MSKDKDVEHGANVSLDLTIPRALSGPSATLYVMGDTDLSQDHDVAGEVLATFLRTVLPNATLSSMMGVLNKSRSED